MRAAIYLRLSKEDVDKDDFSYSSSIQNQRELLEQYALTHHLEIYKTYIDDDYSGLSFERPDFLSMLSDGSRKCFEVVLAKSQSRLSRNQAHIDFLLHDYFPSCGITFIGITDGIDTSDSRNKKVHQINALINEWYSEDLSQSIRAVYLTKMKRGEYLGAYAPYGYCKDPNDHHKLLINEKEAYWVRQIFHYYLQGFSMKRIASLLDEKKVKTPFQKSTHWSTSTIQKILSNEVYLGSIQQGKSYKKNFKSRTYISVPKDKWICVEQMHEPIIDKNTFQKVQKRREKNNRRKHT